MASIGSVNVLPQISQANTLAMELAKKYGPVLKSNANCPWPHKQEIAANCEKYIRAKDTQVSLMIFSSEFKLVKPFVFLSFIFESTDRYNVFHMTHT